MAMQMSSEVSKVAVPESVLRKRKREEQWAAEKKEKDTRGERRAEVDAGGAERGKWEERVM